MLLILYLAAALAIFDNAVGDLTLVSKDDHQFCVASGESRDLALTWISDLGPWEYNPVTTWKSISSASKDLENKLVCNTRSCQAWKRWNAKMQFISSKVVGVNLGPILDYRWEEFSNYRTYNVERDAKTQPHHQNFLQFSILASPGSSLTLWNGRHLTAYQFIFGDKDDNRRTVLSKCITNNVTKETNCSENQVIKNDYQPLSVTKWAHLTLNFTWIENRTDSIVLTLLEGEKTLLTLTDKAAPRRIQRIDLKSNNGEAYFRMHNYSMFTNTGSNTTSVPLTVLKTQRLCLSLNYFLNEGEGKLKVTDKKREHEPVVVNLKSGKRWQTTRLLTSLTENVNYVVSIEYPNKKESMFYIGDIRVCEENEVRYSTVANHKDAFCLQLGTNVKVRMKKIEKTNSGVSCPNTTNFGANCDLTCGLVTGVESCQGVTVCNEQACSCLSGYHGEHCEKECDGGTWGANCAKKCGQCKNDTSCDRTTGICDNGCDEDLEEPYCLKATNVATIVVPLVILLVLVLTGAALLVWCRRRKLQADDSHNLTLKVAEDAKEEIPLSSWNQSSRSSDAPIAVVAPSVMNEAALIPLPKRSKSVRRPPATSSSTSEKNKSETSDNTSGMDATTSGSTSSMKRDAKSSTKSSKQKSATLLPTSGISSVEIATSGSTSSTKRDAKSSTKSMKKKTAPLSPTSKMEEATSGSTSNPTLVAGPSRMVAVNELQEYVEQSIASGELKRQHAMFPRGQTQPWEHAARPENKGKNRYTNLLAYDATRVKLTALSGDEFSDYINANYIDGYNQARCYIATQGPKTNTVNDFWRMVWQESVTVVVMLANCMENGKAKCEQYWPEVSQSCVFGDVTVRSSSLQVFADFTFRNLVITCGNKKRKILHLHFTSWPDHGVPWYSQSVAAFLNKINSTKTNGPIVVHCSAGVGRTGTVILAHICLRMCLEEGQLDPLGNLGKMRAQRPNMVDNYEQYQLVHLALLECLVSEKFNIDCFEYWEHFQRMMANNREVLVKKFDSLNQICARDAARVPTISDVTWPAEKSRFPDIVPGDFGRVLLPGGSDFINAVYVDGFRVKHQFIATQNPLPSTLDDFWHMLVHTGAGLVLVLNQPDPAVDQSSVDFWPTPESDLDLGNSARVVLKQHSDSKFFNYRSVSYTMVDSRMELIQHSVQVIEMKDWTSGHLSPSDLSSLLELWQDAERAYLSGPIVVTCHDGATACGLFLAVSFVVEKMKLEQEVDVGLAVRIMRLNRPNFITNIDQFEILHQVALTYLESFETYANFT